MALKDQLNNEIKAAMKAKKPDRLRALRALKNAIMVAETAEGQKGSLSEEEELTLVTKQAKQRRDSVAQFRENGRDDLAEKEQQELDVIEEFLPKQLDDAALRDEINRIIEETGASSMKDMGRVMGLASQKLAGRADGRRIATEVKSILSGN